VVVEFAFGNCTLALFLRNDQLAQSGTASRRGAVAHDLFHDSPVRFSLPWPPCVLANSTPLHALFEVIFRQRLETAHADVVAEHRVAGLGVLRGEDVRASAISLRASTAVEKLADFRAIPSGWRDDWIAG